MAKHPSIRVMHFTADLRHYLLPVRPWRLAVTGRRELQMGAERRCEAVVSRFQKSEKPVKLDRKKSLP